MSEVIGAQNALPIGKIHNDPRFLRASEPRLKVNYAILMLSRKRLVCMEHKTMNLRQKLAIFYLYSQRNIPNAFSIVHEIITRHNMIVISKNVHVEDYFCNTMRVCIIYTQIHALIRIYDNIYNEVI